MRNRSFIGLCVLLALAATPESSTAQSPRSRLVRALVDPVRSVTGCPTRFAMVDAKIGQPTCEPIVVKGGRWVAVPFTSDPQKDPAGRDPKDVPVRRLPRSQTDAGYCFYEWSSREVAPPEAFKEAGLTPDCPAIARMAPNWSPKDIPQYIWDDLGIETARNLRGVVAGSQAQPWYGKALGDREAIRVAVLDATPRALDVDDPSRHGLGVTRLIGSMICDDLGPRCQEIVRAYLALPLSSENEPPSEKGGFYGHFGHLADALHKALADWDPGKQRLVINLSLGWDPVKAEPESVPVETIRKLITAATCQGALVVASSGNATGTERPLLPAGWEVFPALDAKGCADAGYPFVGQGAGKYRPLVHAVGAVDQYSQRLVSMRPWGQPRLAAYGLAVVGTHPSDKEFPPPAQPIPLSGTSMATAAVSAIAAAVWSHEPGRDGAEIMDIVYGSGVRLNPGLPSLGARTEFCVGEPMGPCSAQPVRRVSLCRALRQVTTPEQACTDARPAVRPRLKPEKEPPPVPTVAVEPCRVQGCGLPVGPYGSDVLSVIGPQDGVPYCPTCKLQRNYGGSGWDLMWGVPTAVPDPFLSLDVRIWTSFWSSQPYKVDMTPQAGVYFHHWIPLQPTIRAAALDWYYYLGFGYARDTELLSVE